MNVRRLRQLLLDAGKHVPFYRDWWLAAGVDLGRLCSAQDLSLLPVIRKADLLTCPAERRLDQRFLSKRMRSEPTSGSTGVPFCMPIDRASLRRRRWRFLRALMAVGYLPGKRLMLISDPPFPRGAAALRWTYADLRLGEEAVFHVYAHARPDVLYGPLSSLLLLAKRVLRSSHTTWQPSLLVSTAEQVTDAHRAVLAAAFAAPLADFYGMTELGLVAYSNPRRSGFRIASTDLHVELLPVPHSGGLERLVVTDLCGGAMPLIRFDTGDLVRREATRTGASPADIVEISGRQVDCLKLPHGAWLSPFEVTLALDRIEGLDQYRVVQRDERCVDLYVTAEDEASHAVLGKARDALVRACGAEVSVNAQLSNEVPTPLGEKQRAVRSHVSLAR